MIKVTPIAWTQVNWYEFHQVAGDVSRRLDEYGVRTDNPVALPFLLNNVSTVAAALSKSPQSTLEHFSITFFIEIENQMASCLFMIPKVKMSPFPNSNRTQLLFTASLLGWREAICAVCSPLAVGVDAARIIMNNCMLHMERLGFGPLWTDYEKVAAEDGTFYLKIKC